jgi:uncharacterized membrane protein
MFAILGAINALYLIATRVKKKSVICMLGHECNTVLESKWNKIILVRNDVAGVFYYVISIALVLISMQNTYSLLAVARLMFSALAFLVSTYLTYVQVRILKSYCTWCLASALINTIIVVLTMVDFLASLKWAT